jgi:hypothetical protein
MWIAGNAGGTAVSANPQIVAGQDGDRLTLRGTASNAAVKFSNGNGVSLMSSEFMIGNDDILNLVYYTSTGWVETSRTIEDVDKKMYVSNSWDFPGIAWDDATIDWDQG